MTIAPNAAHLFGNSSKPWVSSRAMGSKTVPTGGNVPHRLTQTCHHGRCYFYFWRTESLRRGTCGDHRDLVYAGKGPNWSYLLPFTPPPGHYRVDAIAVDGHGNGSAITAGSNRVDFYVR